RAVFAHERCDGGLERLRINDRAIDSDKRAGVFWLGAIMNAPGERFASSATRADNYDARLTLNRGLELSAHAARGGKFADPAIQHGARTQRLLEPAKQDVQLGRRGVRIGAFGSEWLHSVFWGHNRQEGRLILNLRKR